MAKNQPKRDASNWTTPKQFRLNEETLADLDLIAQHMTTTTGVPHTRTDAVRVAAKQSADAIRMQKQTTTPEPPPAGPAPPKKRGRPKKEKVNLRDITDKARGRKPGSQDEGSSP